MTMSHDPTLDPEQRVTGGARAQILEVKDQVVDQAKTSFRQARDSATSSLNDSRHQAADKIGGLASAVRSTSEHLRSENQTSVADVTDSLAEQVERLSGYLRDRDLRRLSRRCRIVRPAAAGGRGRRRAGPGRVGRPVSQELEANG